MTRPEMVRADTLDLQDHETPSAKDHTRQPASPKPLGDGPPAPHQAHSLRKASLEGYDLNVRSPRGSKDLSDKELQLLHDADGDEHDGFGHGADQDLDGQDMGLDDDDDMDDDLMDKISSSPSIDDGGYITQPVWPRRGDSLLHRSFHPQCHVGQAILAVEHSPRTVNITPVGLSTDRFDVQERAYQQSKFTSRVKEVEGSRTPEAPEGAVLPAESHSEMECESLQEPDMWLIGEYMVMPPDSAGSQCVFDSTEKALMCNFERELSPELENVYKDDQYSALWTDERFIDSGWGGECLQEIEDIDFEFVYALHTFVATVEGQANATKGDTMVLLDDSNSYWWLVKIVKDSSIGYLPAEHIETPTERLARLNKHRNIDLSQTMLGDNPEKSRNPLKMAMRRRNAKTVQFTDPIYYEPSEPSYSSDEDEDEFGANLADGGIQAQAQQSHGQLRAAEDESAVVEPLRPSRDKGMDDGSSQSVDSGSTHLNDAERPRSSQDTLDSREDEGPGRRRMRNTDSFYKDDSVETIKKSLTPNLLRDESNSSAIEDTRASMDSQKSSEKNASKDEKPKKEKKEKKSMLGGLFKRKNSKSKHDKSEDLDDLLLSPTSDSTPHDSPLTTPTAAAPQPQKQGKLQKAPKTSGSKRGKDNDEQAKTSRQNVPATEGSTPDASHDKSSNTARSTARQDAPAPLRLVTSNEREGTDDNRSPTASSGKSSLFSPIHTVHTMLQSGNSSDPKETKPEKAKKAKNRMALEDSEGSDEDTHTSAAATAAAAAAAAAAPYTNGQQQQPAHATQRAPLEPLNTAHAASTKTERLSESPIEVSPVASTSHLAPGASYLDAPPSPVSAVSTPELVERPGDGEVLRGVQASKSGSTGPASTTNHATATKTPDANATPSTSTMSSPVTAPSTPQWSPAALRAYIESEGANDLRDLMLLVHDTSDIKDLPQQHELMRGFDGERRKLDGMHKRLDGLLDDILKRTAQPTGII